MTHITGQELISSTQVGELNTQFLLNISIITNLFHDQSAGSLEGILSAGCVHVVQIVNFFARRTRIIFCISNNSIITWSRQTAKEEELVNHLSSAFINLHSAAYVIRLIMFANQKRQARVFYPLWYFENSCKTVDIFFGSITRTIWTCVLPFKKRTRKY